MGSKLQHGVARLHMLMGLPDPMGREGQAKMTPYFDDVMALWWRRSRP